MDRRHTHIRVLVTCALVVVTSTVFCQGVAAADPPRPSPIDEQTQGRVHSGSVRIDSHKSIEPRDSNGGLRGNLIVRHTVADMMAAFCTDTAANAAASGGAPQTIVLLCHGFAALPVAPSREQAFTAFRELGLYRGSIRTDPVDSTLVNLETYFWCADTAGRGCDVLGEGERTVTLLGQPVRIRPRILSYAWDFGDGGAQEITSGKAAHTYRHAATVDVTVTLTWTADYAVGGGAFQAIGDTTTTTSPVRALPVEEAEAVIVNN
jgi:hypothetical protein